MENTFESTRRRGLTTLLVGALLCLVPCALPPLALLLGAGATGLWLGTGWLEGLGLLLFAFGALTVLRRRRASGERCCLDRSQGCCG